VTLSMRRRDLLKSMGCGFGYLALASLAAEEAAGVAKAAEGKDAASAQAIRETVQRLRSRSDLAVKALAHPGS